MPKLKEKDLQLDVLPDPADFRDRLFQPSLVEVGLRIEPNEYRERCVPVLNQGSEGSCTGHALATVAHYLLLCRRVDPDPKRVSPRMFYEMAKRYDAWEGEDYSGSSARGAMKGWHKHGICSLEKWAYQDSSDNPGELTPQRAESAVKRPLGAYLRVNHKDVVAMHSAIAEVGILLATAVIHTGWLQPGRDGQIPMGGAMGGHAFAIVGYDSDGFWLQNSWGEGWGKKGLARVSYDDWLQHGMDVWVARLGVPLHLKTASGAAVTASPAGASSAAYTFRELRPHIISVGNDGELRTGGTYGNSPAELKKLLLEEFRRVTADWSKRRVLLYAHGGLVSETNATQRVADYRAALLEAEVYPLAFIWRTDLWSTVTHLLEDTMRRRRPEGAIEKAKEFLLDRVDDALEPLARAVGGKKIWDEMKENALLAASAEGRAGRLVLAELAALAKADPKIEIHFAAHSAGSIFLAPLVQMLTTRGEIADGPLRGRTGHGLKIRTCTLWAPACTIDLFKETYLPAIRGRGIERFALYNLTDHSERDDDCAGIYHKSLLYLVSRAFEEKQRIPLVGRQAGKEPGTPLLGMESFVRADKKLARLFGGKSDRAEMVLAPNDFAAEAEGGEGATRRASRARHHGDFDDDRATVRSTLARILGAGTALPADGETEIEFQSSAERMSARRKQLTG